MADVINLTVHLAAEGASVANAARHRTGPAPSSTGPSGPGFDLTTAASEVPGLDARLLGAGGFAGAVAGAVGAAVGFTLAVAQAGTALQELARGRGIWTAVQSRAEQELKLLGDAINRSRLAAREEFAERQHRQAQQQRLEIEAGGPGRLDALRRDLIGREVPFSYALSGQYQSFYDVAERLQLGRRQDSSSRDQVGDIVLHVAGSIITERELKDALLQDLRDAIDRGALTGPIHRALGGR